LFQDCNLFCVVFSFVQFVYRDIHHHREHERERVKEVITYMRDGAKARKARIFLSLSISERTQSVSEESKNIPPPPPREHKSRQITDRA
jgi:signal transduction histidine kinase